MKIIHELKRFYYKKIKRKNSVGQLKRYNQELIWAHVYHDTIKDKPWLNDISLNIGRWSGNYTFFFVLNRVLNDFQPKNIIEFGLGESSKVISKYLENKLKNSKHTIIEHDANWLQHFTIHYKLSERSIVKILPIVKQKVKGFLSWGYQHFEKEVGTDYDFYLVDGPFGSRHFSRYDIISIAKKMTIENQFIIVMDDCNRFGEMQTFNELKKVFKKKNIKVYTQEYVGEKSVFVMGSEQYKFIINL